MAFVGMDITTNDGTNTDLSDPIAAALRHCVPDFSGLTVTDGDLALLDSSEIDKLLDLAELRLLENIHNNLDVVDIKVGPRSENLNQFGDQLEKAVTRLEKKCQHKYGIGAGTLSAGVISFDFQQKDESE